MSKTGWKQRERDAASLIHGQRFPANTGGDVDVESSTLSVQVKERRTFSLKQIEEVALEIERVGFQRQRIGVLMVKRSAGKGKSTPWLFVLTEAAWRELHGALPTGP